MPIRILKPTSPGRRRTTVQSFSDLTKKEPEKSLVTMISRHSGRNAQGKITVRHRRGGAKRYYRLVDFQGDKYGVPATVTTLEYDPYRSARIALLTYADGQKRYLLVPAGLKVGDTVCSSLQALPPKVGNRMPLKYIPVGLPVYQLEIKPRAGAKIVRSAGGQAVLMAREGGFAHLELPSGEIRKVSEECSATIGSVSNADWRLVRWGKAGRNYHRGRRPTVRGKAMNPVDHPHGGGEGLSPIGLKHPKTPWGKPALGVKTRKRGKWSDALILKRRK